MIAPAEASANLARYDGVRYGQRTESDDLLEMYERTRHDYFGEEVRRRIMIGTYALSSGYYEAYYGTAQKVRTRIVEDFRSAFERVDLVITPTSPTVAFKLGERIADPLVDVPVRLLHDAGVAGRDPGHLDSLRPVRGAAGGPPARSGPAFSESRILDAAHALERAIGFEGVPRPMSEARAYEPVIGIEIHVQLRTRTKMFCGCANEFGAPPNTLTCPICLAHPGTLPVTTPRRCIWP